MNIGEIIKNKRKQLGMSQTELGKKCGIHYVSVENVEKGKMPTFKTLIALCNALNLEITLTDK